jgi:hypothetical protein
LHIFGPSFLTPYKHVAAALCFEDQIAVESSKAHPCDRAIEESRRRASMCLGIIKLYDINISSAHWH